MGFEEIIVLGVATWRISSLFVEERGPADIFVRIRKMAGIGHDETWKAIIIPDGFLPGILSCIWCFSVWCGIFLTIFYMLFPEVCLWFSLPFFLSGIAIFLERHH